MLLWELPEQMRRLWWRGEHLPSVCSLAGDELD